LTAISNGGSNIGIPRDVDPGNKNAKGKDKRVLNGVGKTERGKDRHVLNYALVSLASESNRKGK